MVSFGLLAISADFVWVWLGWSCLSFLLCGMFCIWCGVLVLWVICRWLGLLVVDLFVAFGLLLLFDSAGLGLLGFFGGLLQYVGLFWFIFSSWVGCCSWLLGFIVAYLCVVGCAVLCLCLFEVGFGVVG